MWLVVLQQITLDFFLDFLRFPLWWYTGGLKRIIFACAELAKSGNMNFAPGLWLRNIFVPMYGQYDWQGRLVSVFIRFVNVIGRFIALCLWIVVVIFLFLLWPIFPVFVSYMFVVSIV